MQLEIVELGPAHWKQVLQIYLEGLKTRQATFETEAPSWQRWDQGHLPFARLAAQSGRIVKGWAALGAVSARAVYAGVAEVSVYVGESWRGHGVGRALLERLIDESEKNGIWTLQASICSTGCQPATAQNHRLAAYDTARNSKLVGQRAAQTQYGNLRSHTKTHG